MQQGLITVGTFTANSAGNIFQGNHEDQMLVQAFMNIARKVDRNKEMRASYREHVGILGQLRDGFFQETNHYGITYIPGGHSTYNGSGE